MTGSHLELLHDRAIRDLAARYCRGVDRMDRELLRSVYWPDGTDDHGAFSGPAWDFVEFVMRTHDRWRATMHCIFNHQIEFDGSDSARGEIYNVTHMFRTKQDGSEVVDHWYGRYLDSYECRRGEWRILHRECVHEGTSVETIDTKMPLDTAVFRSGSIDRHFRRPLGS